MSEFDPKNCLIFKGVDEKYIDNILSSSEIISLKQGEFLFRQEESGDAMYIIESGELNVMLGSKPKIVETLKTGALFGELCVFGHQKRSASIYAAIDSKVLKIEGEDFRVHVYSKELDALLVCYNVAKLLCDRLSATNTLLSCP
jgi:CRP/FNR family transcriptional regulator, cyclic AMP receptor protein